MKQIHIQTVTTQAMLPPGVTFGGYRYTLDPVTPGETATLDTTDLDAQFTDPEPGVYMVTVQAIDSNGNPLGAAVQESVTIDPDPVPYAQPALMTITVATAQPLEAPVTGT